jgi:hypothetical protein
MKMVIFVIPAKTGIQTRDVSFLSFRRKHVTGKVPSPLGGEG